MKICDSSGNSIADKIEMASGHVGKAKGLMGRKDIKDGYGMLFEFSREKYEGFWMLFMKIPIDIIFIDERKRIVDIKHSVKPISINPRTWKIYYPKKPAKWVLEMKSGTMKKLGINIGEKVDF